ncbi:unnamed protein product [Hapterophycus canaliculatus]
MPSWGIGVGRVMRIGDRRLGENVPGTALVIFGVDSFRWLTRRPLAVSSCPSVEGGGMSPLPGCSRWSTGGIIVSLGRLLDRGAVGFGIPEESEIYAEGSPTLVLPWGGVLSFIVLFGVDVDCASVDPPSMCRPRSQRTSSTSGPFRCRVSDLDRFVQMEETGSLLSSSRIVAPFTSAFSLYRLQRLLR